MTQLPLIAVEPKLTDRQARALGFLREAGTAGMSPAKLGALIHDHGGCRYCSSAGRELLQALRRKGLARQRRPRGLPSYWQATHLPAEPLGDLPEGF